MGHADDVATWQWWLGAGFAPTKAARGVFGPSGWTAPNELRVGPHGGERDASGSFSLGFAATWEGQR
jgi:hypothetical protein